MKIIKQIGLYIFLTAVILFTSTIFTGDFFADQSTIEKVLNEKQKKNLGELFEKELYGKTFNNGIALHSAVADLYNKKNEELKANQDWDNVMWGKTKSFTFSIARATADNWFSNSKGLWLFLTFGLGIIGGLMFILPNVILLGPAGIKNNGIFLESATNKGFVGWIVFVFLVSFYVLLYFFPAGITNLTFVVDPVSESLSGNEASQWFLYGTMYCTVMMVMGVRMFIKYRHNAYQMVRTGSVLFFQIIFAYLIPELLVKFNQPWFDFKMHGL